MVDDSLPMNESSGEKLASTNSNPEEKGHGDGL